MKKFVRPFLIGALSFALACTPFHAIPDAGSSDGGGAGGGVGGGTGGTAGKTMTGSGGMATGSGGSATGGAVAGSGGSGAAGAAAGSGGSGAGGTAAGSGGSGPGGALAGPGGRGASGGAAANGPGGAGGFNSAVCTEGVTQSCGAAPLNKKGACGLETATCQNGEWLGCKDTKGADTCEVGNDNSCNGTPNEGCPCANGATQACGHAAIGICKMGKSTCQNGVWGSCSGNVDPAPRDCTSALDNDCDGKPDSTVDSVCKCASGSSQVCGAHPGSDGKGACKAGSQNCVVVSSKATSDWGACSGSVGPAAADTCDANNDANCNGTANDGCACVNGSTVTCACGPATTCVNGVKGTCSVSKVTMYRDADGDGFGNAALSSQQCPETAGYSTNLDDCDDSNASFKPGVSVCTTISQRSTCTPAGGGTPVPQTCTQGCFNGNCRTDGTVGLPGYVTCMPSGPKCTTTDGCDLTTGFCKPDLTMTSFTLNCDGPNDCPGGACFVEFIRGLTQSMCASTLPGGQGGWYQVCDPMAPACPSGTSCVSTDDNLHACE